MRETWMTVSGILGYDPGRSRRVQPAAATSCHGRDQL